MTSQPVVEFRLWGKSKGLTQPYPLLAHLVDTSAVAYALVKDHLPLSTIASLGLDREDDTQLRSFAFVAGLHDLGKATPVFQRRDGEGRAALAAQGYGFPAGPEVFHDHATQLSLPEALRAAGFNAPLGDALDGQLGLSCMLGGHHGVFKTVQSYELHISERPNLIYREPQLGEGEWEAQREAHVTALALAVDAPWEMPDLSGHQLVLAAGVVVISDWLASQEDSIGPPASWPSWEKSDWGAWFDAKTVAASDAVRSSGLEAPRFTPMSFADSFGGNEPRPLQASLDVHLSEDASPGILVVAAPMGVGKTEAALLASQRMGAQDSGVLFLLPTMATADAMFGRVVDYARRVIAGETVEAALVHSMASLNVTYTDLPDRNVDPISDDAETVAVASRWLRGRQRTLLAPVAAGTIDQLLAATLRSRRGFLRWLGLSGKTVIIDEAHSFDAYMHGLLITALTWLGRFGVPVIVMSATLPERISREMVEAWCRGAGVEAPNEQCPYPGWQHVSVGGEIASDLVGSPDVTLGVRVVEVPRWSKEWTARVEERLAGVETEGCALVVCNTVADAQELVGALAPWAEQHEIELSCLHARFRQQDRRDLTQKALASFGGPAESRPRRAVLVATQIVEQSLDVDFDIVISCLAPVAALLQRAGRGHRHDRPRPAAMGSPMLEVLVPVDGAGELAFPKAWGYVYPEVYLERTWEISLGGGTTSSWALPGDVQGVVDQIYGSMADAELSPALLEQMDKEWLESHANPISRIPEPDAMASLAELSSKFDEELLLATRLGMETTQVVCAWSHPMGLTLDEAGTQPLPETLSREAIRAVLGASVPLRSTSGFTKAIASVSAAPERWADDPWLDEAVVLALDPTTRTAQAPGWVFHLDPLAGLLMERV